MGGGEEEEGGGGGGGASGVAPGGCVGGRRGWEKAGGEHRGQTNRTLGRERTEIYNTDDDSHGPEVDGGGGGDGTVHIDCLTFRSLSLREG